MSLTPEEQEAVFVAVRNAVCYWDQQPLAEGSDLANQLKLWKSALPKLASNNSKETKEES